MSPFVSRALGTGCSGRNCSREQSFLRAHLVPGNHAECGGDDLTASPERVWPGLLHPQPAELPAAAVEGAPARLRREPCDDVPLAGRASVSLLGPGLTVAASQAVGRIWRENVGLPPARPGKPPNAVPPPHAQVASLFPQAGHWPWLAGGLPGQGLHHPPGLPSPLTAVRPLGGMAPCGMPRPRVFHPSPAPGGVCRGHGGPWAQVEDPGRWA